MTAAGGPQALIVEDRPFVALVISDVLREVGFDGLHAFDCPEALRVLERSPDVAIAIIEAGLSQSEGCSGLDLARTITRQRPRLPIVITVAGGDIAADELPKGARLLRKPFASAELRALVGGMSLLEEA